MGAAQMSPLPGVEGARLYTGTVGEAAAENRPGPDGRPLVAHLRALTLATPDGQLRRASPERAPELFRLAVGGLGAFGPYYSLTLDLASLASVRPTPADPIALPPFDAERQGMRHTVDLLLPPEGAQAAISRLREAIAERRFALVRMEARRTLAEEVTFLRWARRDCIALRVQFAARATLGASVSAAQLRAKLIDVSIEASGSFMPVTLPVVTRAQAQACYPMLGEFLDEQRRLDPGARVGTPWIRGAARMWRGEPCRVRFN
jgi:hypothetical protein